MELLLLDFQQEELGDGSPHCRHRVFEAVAGLLEGVGAWCDAEPGAGTLVSCLAALCTITPFPQAPQAPSVERLTFRVSCSSPGSASTSPVCLTDAAEQPCLSLSRRRNESPTLISLCLATAQTLKLPEMGRK